MTKARLLFLVFVAGLLASLVPAAGAQSTGAARAERERARQRRSQLARELDTLNASESQLDAAVAALDAEVRAQSSHVESARQALAVAEGELAEAERRLAETEARIATITEALVTKAVESFMQPPAGGFDEVVNATDVGDAARRQALLEQVSANDEDLIDSLNAAFEDQTVARGEAEAAAVEAAARRAESEARLGELESARDEKARVQAAVEERQNEVLGEIDAQAAAESNLTRIITESEARANAIRSQRSSQVGGGSPGTATGGGGCIWPARGTVTSEYGSRWGRLHAGIDISAPIGTPIWAAKDGVVVFAGTQSGYGNVVIVDHGGGLSTLYGHQSRLAASDGESVSQGEVIGYVGNTGRSTGPHLHFETRSGGSPRNPRGCLP
jgi:murein DD-endopeptidase MepM/ murein hydrolase activator NlpD